jgi:WD40 repeat protein
MRLASFHNSLQFASSSFDGTVRIWRDGKQEKVLFFFSEAIEGLEVTPDDKNIIVVLGDSSKAYIHNLESQETKEMGKNLVIRNLFGTNPGNTKTAIVTFDDDVYIYNHDTDNVGTRIYIENVSGDSLIWLNDDIFCVPKRNGTIVVINSEKLSIEKEIQVHEGLITSICRSNDIIITVSEDGTGKVLDLDFNPKFGFKLPFTPLSVDYNVRVGTIVVSGDRNLLLVNTNTGDIVTYDQGLSGCNAIITADSKIIKGTGQNEITIYSELGEEISKIDGRSHTAENVVNLENNRIIFASGDKQVHLLDCSSGEDQTLAKHKETISSVIFLPSKNYIIAGAYDDTVSIWDLTKHSEIKRIKKLPLVTALSESPSNEFFVIACSGDNTLHLFTTEGTKKTSWKAHDEYISTVRFMNDEVIISGSDDENLKFWNLKGKLISSIQTASPVKSIDTSPESEYNVTGHLNGELNFFEKITNRKIASFKADGQVQRIKVINGSYILFAAQNVLYLLQMDGHHIVDVHEITTHTEPIRGIFWNEKPPKVISIAHNIEVMETEFVPSGEYPSSFSEEIISEESSPSTVIFAPRGLDEELGSVEDDKISTQVEVADLTKPSNLSTTDIENLTKIMEYLTTVNIQISDLVIPKLQKYGIISSEMKISIEKVQKEINQILREAEESENILEEPSKKDSKSKEKKPDWTSIDWGRRRKNGK